MNCCDSFGECRQGRDCPVRTFYLETEGVMPMVTGCSFKALPDPAKQPLPPIEPPRDTTDHIAHLLQGLAVTAAFGFLLAATAGFFTNK